jgi:GMP synthase (glutamine-hydrolysing)
MESITANTKCIILSGSPYSTLEENSPTIDSKIFELGLPILGICYGQQLMAKILGGKVENHGAREFGKSELNVVEQNPFIDENSIVWMSHGDCVTQLPQGFKVLAKTKNAPFAVITNEEKNFYGVQFHPEVTHTESGREMLKHFVINISKCKQEWTMSAYKTETIAKIKAQIGNEMTICALSGGVDSAVAARLVYEAIGKNLICVLVDTGLLRKGEVEQIKIAFPNINVIDAKKQFLRELAGICDPEQKRKTIGRLFIEHFQEFSKKYSNAKFLVQGTIYPDVIESAGSDGLAQTIKSHHNVGGLPKDMKMELCEPLRELFKDEVRLLGEELGMDKKVIYRHPFPGPGLGIRILGEVTPEKVEILQNADKIYIDFLHEKELYDKIWQAFSVLLPCKTVGVMGDGRTYEFVLALRAITSEDGMTAQVYPFEMANLLEISTRIVNNVKGVNRVTYDITSKPPATIEWE